MGSQVAGPAVRISPARIASAHRRRQERIAATLARLRDWSAGMPPLAAIGSDIGTLVGLEREGLVRRLGRDQLGDLRFVLTADGARASEAAP